MRVNPKVDPQDLPSLQSFRRATLGAVVVAVVLAITVVLPAERGIDLTGVGGWLGLTALGELKTAGVPHAAPPEAVVLAGEVDAVEPASTFRIDELELVLKPGEGAEIKAVMGEGDHLSYRWAADHGELFFDFHGEPKGGPSSEFTSFEKGTSREAKGEFEAPFEGTHGWYWKNKAAVAVTVSLETSGVYKSIGPS